MEQQRQAALEAMKDWLAHPQELGRAPEEIEITEEFDLHDLHYYVFRYRRDRRGQWLLGVCGGYGPGETEHCGHVFSQMERYDPATAKEQAIAMVEQLRAYWMERARQAAQADEGRKTGPFAGFVLLATPQWDEEQFKRDLREDWGIFFPEEEGKAVTGGGCLAFDVDGMTAAVGLMPAPVPHGEAEQNAANNYQWPQAVETAKAHQGHLAVAVMGGSHGVLDRGRLWVKLTAACLKQANATGVYACGTVFQPAFYLAVAQGMKEGGLPLLDWVYMGLYRTERGMSGYTYGMNAFGKDEMEVLDTKAQPEELLNFLCGLCYYVLEEDVTLRDGETIGFSAGQKLAITRSEARALEGMTLEIQYPEA